MNKAQKKELRQRQNTRQLMSPTLRSVMEVKNSMGDIRAVKFV